VSAGPIERLAFFVRKFYGPGRRNYYEASLASHSCALPLYATTYPASHSIAGYFPLAIYQHWVIGNWSNVILQHQYINLAAYICNQVKPVTLAMQETTYRTNPSISRAFFAIALTCLPAWLFAYLSMNVFEDYALGMFIWLPVMMGAVSTMIYGYRNTTGRITLRNMSYAVLVVFCLGLLTFAWEGIICLVMAAPLGILFTYFGFLVGYALIRSRVKNNTPVTIIIFLLSVPAFMAFEHTGLEKESIRSVTTSIQIKASPEAVWENVIAFPELKNPEEFVFKTGIAYPVNATIKGRGVGAVRHCNFSTGSFVEPITV